MKATKQLHYKKYGSGDPLIILHGLFGCADNWHPVWKDVENRLASDIPEADLRLFLLKKLRRAPDGKFRWKVNLDAIWRHYPALCGPVAVRPFLNPCLFIRGGNSNYLRDAD